VRDASVCSLRNDTASVFAIHEQIYALFQINQVERFITDSNQAPDDLEIEVRKRAVRWE
jgi:hypothetical protein